MAEETKEPLRPKIGDKIRYRPGLGDTVVAEVTGYGKTWGGSDAVIVTHYGGYGWASGKTPTEKVALAEIMEIVETAHD